MSVTVGGGAEIHDGKSANEVSSHSISDNDTNNLIRLEKIHSFFAEHNNQLPSQPTINKKKLRYLLSISDKAFETYKLGVIVSNCCRVSLRF